MKYSLAVKFLVILLTACSFVTAAAGAAGIVSMESSSLYVNSVDSLLDRTYGSISQSIAKSYAQRYAAERLGDLPYVLRENLFPDPMDRSDADHWYVSLWENGEMLAEDGAESGALESHTYSKTYNLSPLYPIVSLYGPNDVPPEEPPVEGENPENPQPTEPDATEETKPLVPKDYLYYERQNNWENGSLVTYYLYYYQAPEYTVQVYLQEDVLDNSSLQLLTDLYPHRYTFIAVLAVSLTLFAIGLVYLCWSAGRHKDGRIQPEGLNRLPLDLYAILGGVGIWLLYLVFAALLRWTDRQGFHPGNISLMFVNLLAMSLVVLAFLCAFSAQIKMGSRTMWDNMLLGRLSRALKKGCIRLWRGSSAMMSLLPLIWQWLATALVMVVMVFVSLMLTLNASGILYPILLLVSILLCFGIILYGGYAFGTLAKGVQRMSQGDLSFQIPTKYLHGSFLSFAKQLNALSETAMIAAENQMKSERMRSELITNVSHDIKTPLTSIINFVDLLQKPHSPAESEMYLEVLSRQSSRMKKLIEDLMELSKASSGNIAVHLTAIDAGEAVQQALGEFSDKLEAVSLEPLFQQPENPMMIQADGRLMWRVLSNLLSNAVKYAMPGTRLYVDLAEEDGQVLLSLKNVSKEPLTVSAEDLMERFVRGDVSRNSEGSGLGLNIAKSLMEVQKGHLQILLDGDLFKVTLVFPGCS